MGLLTGDGPGLNIVPLDSGTQQLINSRYGRATASDAKIAGDANAGVAGAGAQAMQSDQSLKQQAASTGQDESMLKAIRNQYNQVAAKGIQDVVKKNEMNTGLMRSQMLSEAAHSAIARQNVETQNYEMLTNAMNQAEAARAQVLSSVLGVAGLAGGMYMGGRHPRMTQSPQVQQMGGQGTGNNLTAFNE